MCVYWFVAGIELKVLMLRDQVLVCFYYSPHTSAKRPYCSHGYQRERERVYSELQQASERSRDEGRRSISISYTVHQHTDPLAHCTRELCVTTGTWMSLMGSVSLTLWINLCPFNCDLLDVADFESLSDIVNRPDFHLGLGILVDLQCCSLPCLSLIL